MNRPKIEVEHLPERNRQTVVAKLRQRTSRKGEAIKSYPLPSMAIVLGIGRYSQADLGRAASIRLLLSGTEKKQSDPSCVRISQRSRGPTSFEHRMSARPAVDVWGGRPVKGVGLLSAAVP